VQRARHPAEQFYNGPHPHNEKSRLEYEVTDDTENGGRVADPKDRDIEIVFVRVPENKLAKNRIHLDIGSDDREKEVSRLSLLGAHMLKEFPRWTVMQDPEGNEFCVLEADPNDPIESWRS
jgi:hypothetical protein